MTPSDKEMTRYESYLASKPRRPKRKKRDGPITFKVPKKKDKGDAGKPQEPDTPEAFEQRLIQHVRATGNPEVAVTYQALLGSARPVARALMCNRPLIKEAEDHIVSEVRKCLAEGSSQFGVQITRVAVTNGEKAIISIADCKKPRSLYEKAELDGIAALRLCPVPSEDPCSFAIAADVVALWWGQDAKRKLEDRLRRIRPGGQMEQSPTQWFEPNDLEYLRLVTGSMLSAPFHQLPRQDPFHASSGAFPRYATPGERALITLMCRAQLPVRKALMHFGGGKPIIAGALAKMDHVLKTRCKAAPEILHEDAVAHFLFSELRRLDMDDFSVPIVKLR